MQAELYYAHYRPDEWRSIIESAGFEIATFHTTDNAGSCNIGATGWIEVTARTPGSS